MNLSDKNFFGPQTYLSEIITYPPYSERITMTRYGYETGSTIYDVCIPEKPIGERQITRWYKTNGYSSETPSAIHKAVEKKFSL